MKLLVDATTVSKGGLQTYLEGLVRGWRSVAPDDLLRVISTDELDSSIVATIEEFGSHQSIGNPSIGNRIRAQQWTILQETKHWKPDALFCTAPVAALALRNVPLISVAHDFRHLHRPAEFSRVQRAYRRVLYPATLRKSDAVIANSRATAEEVLAITGRSEHDVKVVYMGAPQVAPVVQFEMPAHGGHALANGHWTNKQPDMAIKTWGRLRNLLPTLDVQLHITGVRSDQQAPLMKVARESMVEDLVTIHDYLPDADYQGLLTTARLILMPSTFEGFGLPVLEALALGVPMVASCGIGLEEAGGECIWYAHPSAPEQFAEQCLQILSERATTSERVARGKQRAARFTWESTALQTRRVIQDVIDACGKQ